MGRHQYSQTPVDKKNPGGELDTRCMTTSRTVIDSRRFRRLIRIQSQIVGHSKAALSTAATQISFPWESAIAVSWMMNTIRRQLDMGAPEEGSRIRLTGIT